MHGFRCYQKFPELSPFFLEPSKPAIDTTDEPKAIKAPDRSPITLTIGDNVTALTNTSITIQCPTSGVPTPTVTWTKDGQEIPSGDRYTVQDDGSLVISKTVEEDSARYTCTAESVAGKDSASSMVQVVGKSIEDCLEYPLKLRIGTYTQPALQHNYLFWLIISF